ncbi:MAG: TetR/AcrR family transcriptional regulator [Solirubrobacteraceae bacterium]|nr:TetR/AcrR family transcriptional regulator [Solirubrobacteraceae bacterium]
MTVEGGTRAPRRRTQEERRAATRTALLDATIACLVEHGYAGATTTRIVERAGVSRGAQVHHYPTKAALVVAALERLAVRRTAEAADELRGLKAGPDRVDALLDALWETHAGPLFVAALELWTAARTDAELREHMVAAEGAVNRAVTAAIGRILGIDPMPPALVHDVALATSTMRGLALIDISAGVDAETSRRRWLRAREGLRRGFSPETTAALAQPGRR